MYYSRSPDIIQNYQPYEKAGNCDNSQEKEQSMEINPEMIQILEPEVMDFKATMLRIEGKIGLIMNIRNLAKKESFKSESERHSDILELYNVISEVKNSLSRLITAQ